MIEDTVAIIKKDFNIEIGESPLTEEELLDILANRVADMLDYDMDFLLSLLYRLDVDELKIRLMLSNPPGGDSAMGLAVLILERQKQRVASRNAYAKKKRLNLDKQRE
jgi:hypothetical protein